MRFGTSRRSIAIASLLAATVCTFPAVATAARAATASCTPASSWPSARADLASRVVELVNERRENRGLQPLRVTQSLTASAVWKARHMAHFRYLAHNDPAPPDARGVGERLEACGYSGSNRGENIAYGFRTPQAVMQAWLSSPSHRANIDNPRFGSIGVGAAVAENGVVYWAQNFGG